MTKLKFKTETCNQWQRKIKTLDIIGIGIIIFCNNLTVFNVVKSYCNLKYRLFSHINGMNGKKNHNVKTPVWFL